jgi:hypothetical protein
MDITLQDIDSIETKEEWIDICAQMAAALRGSMRDMWEYYQDNACNQFKDHRWEIAPRFLYYMLRKDYYNIRKTFWRYGNQVNQYGSDTIDYYFFSFEDSESDSDSE